MKKADYVAQVFEILSKENPNPKSELNYINEYTFLVAVILSAQATDKGVNKATPALFKKVKTPQAMLKLGLEGLLEYIKTIGLYNSKGKNIMGMSKMLVSEYGGKVPHTREDLEKLPGVGRKSANVFLNEVLGEPTVAVDTHVLRLAPRLGLTKPGTPLEVEAELLKVVPKKYLIHASDWLVLHGRYVCEARKPKCGICKLAAICPSHDKFI